MRTSLKKISLRKNPILGLPLLLCLFSVPAFSDDNPCEKSDVANYGKANLDTQKQKFCPMRGACSAQLDKHAAVADSFAQEIAVVCGEHSGKITFDPSQSKAIEKSREMMTEVSASYKKLAGIAERRAKEVTAQMSNAVREAKTVSASQRAALPPTDTSKVEKIGSKVSGGESVVGKNELPDSPQLKEKLSSTQFGSLLRQELLKFKREAEAKSIAINAQLENPNGPNGDPKSPTDTTSDKKSGGFMDSLTNPSTLMGLGTAGLGLMSALKKNSDNSGVSTPQAPEPIAPIAPSSLGAKDSSGNSQKVNLSSDKPKEDTAAIAPTGFSGQGLAFPESNVSSKSSAPNSSGGPQSSSGTGGGLPSTGDSSSESHREPGSAAGLVAGKVSEDSSGSYAGGGGSAGAINFGPSSGSGSDSPPTEDPLKETLHDMAAAIDNGSGAEVGKEGFQAGDEQLEGENSEVLFTRVKSCIQRSVKKGLVISGLTAKIR